MKKLNIILMIVLALLIAFVVYFFIGGTMNARASTITASATDHPEAFASIQNVLNSNSAPQVFSGEVPQSAEGYTLVDTTIALTNQGLFDAEWVTVSVNGTVGDVAVYSLTGEGSAIEAHSTGQVNLKIITTAPKETARRVTITYYVYGMLRTVSMDA